MKGNHPNLKPINNSTGVYVSAAHTDIRQTFQRAAEKVKVAYSPMPDKLVIGVNAPEGQFRNGGLGFPVLFNSDVISAIENGMNSSLQAKDAIAKAKRTIRHDR